MTGYGFAVFAVGFFGALSALIWALTYPEQTLLKPVPGPPSDGDRHTAPPESDDLGGSEDVSPGASHGEGVAWVRKPATRRAVAVSKTSTSAPPVYSSKPTPPASSPPPRRVATDLRGRDPGTLGDPNRFTTLAGARAFTELVPILDSSGLNGRHGGPTKRGDAVQSPSTKRGRSSPTVRRVRKTFAPDPKPPSEGERTGEAKECRGDRRPCASLEENFLRAMHRWATSACW